MGDVLLPKQRVAAPGNKWVTAPIRPLQISRNQPPPSKVESSPGTRTCGCAGSRCLLAIGAFDDPTAGPTSQEMIRVCKCEECSRMPSGKLNEPQKPGPSWSPITLHSFISISVTSLVFGS